MSSDNKASVPTEPVEATPAAAPQPAKVPAPVAAYQDDPIRLMTYDMVDRLTKYISGEIQATAEDYILLEQLNVAASARYEDMSKNATALIELSRTIQERRAALQPHLDQIDALHDNVVRLTEVMKGLDEYTSELEKQFSAVYD